MARLGFTAFLLTLVIATGIATGAAWHRLPHEIADRVAFAPIDLRTGSWHRLLTSLAFAGGPAAFWKVLALIAIACGGHEWRTGWRATAVGFTFVQLATLLAVSAVVLDATAMGQPWATRVADTYDVGPSVGCYGCFGMLLGEVSSRWRAALVGGYLIVTALNLSLHLRAFDPVQLASDGEHALAILVGWVCRPRARPALPEVSPPPTEPTP